MKEFPCIQAVAYSLAHTPDLVRYGSKPTREIESNADYRSEVTSHLRTFEQAAGYLPNQVFLGLQHPGVLDQEPRPWWEKLVPANKGAKPGLCRQEDFYGWLKCSDGFDLLDLDSSLVTSVEESLSEGGLLSERERDALLSRSSAVSVKDAPGSLPLFQGPDQVGWIRSGHELDSALCAPVLLENLCAKATAALAVKELFREDENLRREEIDYVINSGEEAVGDRYQRGGGNLAKAIAEQVDIPGASGCDVKAFCCGPVHALIMAAALVEAKIFKKVLVVGGASLAKLGMKAQAHLKMEMPVLEDVLAGFAILVAPFDGESPVIRLDAVGKHDIRRQSSAKAIAEALVSEPLARIGRSLTSVSKYAVELHNPEITEPAGSGDVPKNNYRVLASLAALKGEIDRDDIPRFVQKHGMTGFSPTQGHVASAIPYLGHARRGLMEGSLEVVQLIAKGSLFLGKMTQLADGASLLLDAPN